MFLCIRVFLMLVVVVVGYWAVFLDPFLMSEHAFLAPFLMGEGRTFLLLLCQ